MSNFSHYKVEVIKLAIGSLQTVADMKQSKRNSCDNRTKNRLRFVSLHSEV